MTLITPHLAVGHFEDSVRYERQIDAFLCCAEELLMPQGKPGFHLPLRDGEPIDGHNLDTAFRFLDEQLQEKAARPRVLRRRAFSLCFRHYWIFGNEKFQSSAGDTAADSEVATGGLPVGADFSIGGSIC